MRLITLRLLRLYGLLSWKPGGEWITDAKTKCKVWDEDPRTNYSVFWSGECLNGYASGKGILVFYETE